MGRTKGTPFGWSGAISLSTGVVLALLVICATASAATPKLWKRCEKGSAAAQCLIPRGIASDPSTGHIYVADQSNQRIVELTAWGEFVKAWGWGVKDGGVELQTCSAATTCRKGLVGSGKGEFSEGGPQGIATDSSGNVYVVDLGNHRVQKFDREGHFLLMFGGEVNETSGGSLCPRPGFPADACKTGTTGVGNGQFGEWPVSSFIAIGPANQVYVGDKGRIQEFDTAGTFLRVLPDPEGRLTGKQVGSLAVDPKSGALYFAYPNPGAVQFESASHDVFRLDPGTGNVTNTLTVGIPRAVATGPDGNVYVLDQRAQGGPQAPGNHITRLLRFDPSGKLTEVVAQNEEGPNEKGNQGDANEFETSTGLAAGSACFNAGYDVYLSNSTEDGFVSSYGLPPDKTVLCPRPLVPPSIDDQYAVSVGANDAVLGAKINPHFWDDTVYYLEYGTQPCFEGGCKVQPAPSGSALGAGIVEGDVAVPGVFLSGLAPGTTYHYRFVAQSGGGGPLPGSERTFTTFPLSGATSTCPANEVFRIGLSSLLPDCRAYEMVSPVDKEGGDIVAGSRLDQSATSGNAFTYSSSRAFGQPQSAPFASQYIASRNPAAGWSSTSISPPQEGENLLPDVEGTQLFSPFKAFSPDLSVGWNTTFTEPVLGLGGQAGFPNLYRRDNAAGSYRACTTTQPLQTERNGPQLQGVSADQGHAIWRIQNRVTTDASSAVNAQTNEPIFQLYECSFGEGENASVRLVSLLPNGSASTQENTAGTPPANPAATDFVGGSWLANAISADGSRVFWTAFPGSLFTAGGPGTIYVRVNSTAEQSPVNGGGECTKSFKACTYPVSGSAGTEPGHFWGAAPDGSNALFAVEGGSAKGDLYVFDVDKAIAKEEPKTLVAHKTIGVLGTSEDLGRIYFASEESIGGKGTAGKSNLYLYEAGEVPTTTFIATLSGIDANVNNIPSSVNERPDEHTARVTPNGSHLAFMSNSTALSEATAGYDNTDLQSGQPDAEVYRFSASSKALACVSCNRTGARPSTGRKIGETQNGTVVGYAAARLAPWMTSLYPTRPLSVDGARVVFESFEPLVLADTNGKADVYQWEEAGSGSCVEGDSSYVGSSGGCVSLISSGKSPADSEFIDADPSGTDVFFTTAASLLPQDPGSIDLYDARVDGGFPSPPAPRPGCEGQACQNPAAAPNDPTPASSIFRGSGNVKEGNKAAKPCGKGKHKVKKGGKTSCVKNQKKGQTKHRRHRGTNRRAAR